MQEASARTGSVDPSSRCAAADEAIPSRLRWAGKGLSASLPLLAVVFKYCFVAASRIQALSGPSWGHGFFRQGLGRTWIAGNAAGVGRYFIL